MAIASVMLFGDLIAGQEAKPAEPASAKFYEALIIMPIIPARSADAIQADLTRADEDRQKAEQAVAACNAQVIEAEGWIKLQKLDIDGLKLQIDAAKKEKRDADKAALEAQKKEHELVQDFLEKLKSVREAALNLAKAQQVLASACQADQDLAQKRGTWAAQPAGDAGAVTAARSAFLAEETVSQALKDLADKQSEVYDKQKKLNDRRIDLAKARTVLLNDGRLKTAQPPVLAE
jgi:hypothetical protein